MRHSGRVALLLALCTPPVAAASDLPLVGAEAEELLRSAKVLDLRILETGVTRSRRATLSNGELAFRGAWKTIDIYEPLKHFYDGGPPEIGFRDCYKHEIAAYELAKLLGLDLVPPTVYRRIGSKGGSLQLWVEDAMTEAERRKQKIRPPDIASWNRQIHNVRLLRSLTDDRDYKNSSNVLVGPGFRVWAIDFSRAFRLSPKLNADLELSRFSSTVLDRLRALDKPTVGEVLGRWLTKLQRQKLLERRDRIVQLADRLIEEQGEEAILFQEP